jgi:hypothetical protein
MALAGEPDLLLEVPASTYTDMPYAVPFRFAVIGLADFGF